MATTGKIKITQKFEIILSYDAAKAPPLDAVGFSIKYKKPGSVLGTLTPAIIDRNARTISYIGSDDSKYETSGIWRFWAYADMGTGKSPYESDAIEVTIEKSYA